MTYICNICINTIILLSENLNKLQSVFLLKKLNFCTCSDSISCLHIFFRYFTGRLKTFVILILHSKLHFTQSTCLQLFFDLCHALVLYQQITLPLSQTKIDLFRHIYLFIFLFYLLSVGKQSIVFNAIEATSMSTHKQWTDR